MTKIDAAYLRFLGCILATSPEEFYRNYPLNGRHFNAKGKNYYWSRMMGNDKDYKQEKICCHKSKEGGGEVTEPIFLSIRGETPAKKNSRITLRNGKTIPSKRYRDWHSAALFQLEEQWKGKGRGMFENEIHVNFHFFHEDNRRRDSDNGVSSIFDTLQDAGIISDDRWQIVREFSVKNTKAAEARCEIEIIELEKTRFIAVPENLGETMFFTDLNDLLDYSQLKKEEVKTAVEEGFSVYMAGKRYFIDEDLS